MARLSALIVSEGASDPMRTCSFTFARNVVAVSAALLLAFTSSSAACKE
jgi:hypothetical protein